MLSRLKTLRKEKKLNQFDVAKSLGINPQYYSMIERGARTPGFSLAKKIADLFGVSVDDLFFANTPNNSFGKSDQLNQAS